MQIAARPAPTRTPRHFAGPAAAQPGLFDRRRGGVLAWVIGAVCFAAAALTLAWMILLPGAAQARFAAATGSDLAIQGLAADPFAGRATVTGWTLRASASHQSPVLARGDSSSITATGWQAAISGGAGSTATIDELDLHVAEARLAPDAKGRWALLSLAAAAGLPYERGGAVGEGPRIRVRRLRLRVDELIVRDGNTGRDARVRVDWRGEFSDLDHTKPVVAALLEAVRVKTQAGRT